MINSTFRQQAHRALAKAFDQPHLAEFLQNKLEVRMDRISPPGDFTQTIGNVVKQAEIAGWLPDLVKAAYEEMPENSELAELYRTLGFSSRLEGLLDVRSPLSKASLSAVDPGLESTIQAAVGLSAPDWRRHLRDIEPAVCRVEVKGRPTGTGFLVGPDLVLTAFCVVQSVIKEPWSPALLRFRFDYRGQTYPGDSGSLRTADPEWLIDHDGYDVADNDEGLDFALIRLQSEIGQTTTSPPRRWLPVPKSLPVLKKEDPLVMARYPNLLSDPLTISVDTKGVHTVDKKAGLLLHGDEGGPGSAGAPCFNSQFALVAMHHAARPLQTKGLRKKGQQAQPAGMEGIAILITAIRNKLKSSGNGHLLP